MSKYVSIVIPAFNEAENLPSLVKAIEEVFADIEDCRYECLIVDDGSTDNTRSLLSELVTANDNIRPIHMARNSGQSAALLAGMRLSKGEYILTLDADLQNDPCDFPKIIELLGKYDCVCGYRKKRNDNFLRLLTSRVGNLVRRRIVDDGIRDAGCGTKGFRRACIEHFVPFNGVHRFFAAMVRNGGLSIAEIPVTHHPRLHGVSKYGLVNRLFWVLYDFIGVAWLRRRYIRIDVEPEGDANASDILVEAHTPAMEIPLETAEPLTSNESLS